MDSILIKIDSIFGVIVGYIAEVLFYKGFPFFGFPFIVLVYWQEPYLLRFISGLLISVDFYIQ